MPGKLPPVDAFDRRVSEIDRALKDDGYGTFMRRRDVQESLSIAKSTVYKLIDDGQLESVKLARQLRIRRRDVARFVAMGDVKPPRPT